MKINWKAIFIIIITGFMAITSDDVHSKANGNIDVVLVMDSSGSMKNNDPTSLRIPAAKLFISLLDKNDRASVVSFSDKSYPLIQLTPVNNEKNKDQLLKAAEKITSAGLFTNLYDALRAGLDILSEDEKGGRSKIIVLMSDGMMDVGDTDKDRELVDRIRNEMATTLEDQGIKVYAIAFTEQSDRLLLDRISKQTGGFYNLALSDRDFHLIFTSIFESLKRPDMLPISEKGFLIDSSIEEVTIVATKATPQTRIRLNAPDGRSYSDKEKFTGIGWFVSDNFDMITIKSPARGRWEILFSTGENNKVYVITNLELQTNFDQLYSTFGDPLDIRIWLEKDGITITEQDVLNKLNIYIELTGPDGQISKLSPFNKGEGIFVRNIAPFTPGNYKLRMVAQGNTFEREKAFVFNIADAKESKEDILVKRGKDKKVEEQAKRMPAKDDITDIVSWKKVISQFIAIDLLLSISALIYFKRNSLKDIKGIKKIGRLTKLESLMTGKKVGGQEEEKELKQGQNKQEESQAPQKEKKREEPEEHKPATVLEVKEDQKVVVKQVEISEKREEEAQIREIPLEEEDQGVEELLEKARSVNEKEVDAKEQKQEIVHEEDHEAPDIAGDKQLREIENQQILNQEDLDQLLGVGNNEDAEKGKEGPETDFTLEARNEGENKSQKAAGDQEKIENKIQNEEMEDIDAIWEEAMQQQNAAEDKSNDKKESVSGD